MERGYIDSGILSSMAGYAPEAKEGIYQVATQEQPAGLSQVFIASDSQLGGAITAHVSTLEVEHCTK